jgi:hypothetical protein
MNFGCLYVCILWPNGGQVKTVAQWWHGRETVPQHAASGGQVKTAARQSKQQTLFILLGEWERRHKPKVRRRAQDEIAQLKRVRGGLARTTVIE